MASDQVRTYHRASSVVFLKTDAPFGGLSNMAGGFPLHVQGTRIYTSEALYQACRFPHLPEVQRLIIGQASPMTAKMKSKPHRKDSRPDWDRVRVKVMRWCLRVKLAQNWAKFSELLLRTDDRPIVEESRRDDFWGAKPVNEQTLVGMNVLGRLLMELREAVKAQGPAGFQVVEPLDIPEFLFLGRPIGTVGAHELGARDATPTVRAPDHEISKEAAEQGSLFDTPAAREGSAAAYITSPTPESTRLSELKPYPAIKDSGVPWLGEVPEHWGVLPNRAIFDEVKERDRPDADMLSVTITKGVIRQQALLEDSSKKDSSKLDRSAYKLVRQGDIAYNKMRAWQGAVGVSEYEGIVSPAYVVQRPREGAAPRYLHYLLRTPAFAKEAERWSYGITSDMWSLRPEHFKMIYSCLPPLPEQVAIVRFLDHADRRIRRYIRAKQKLIKLLEEQKQAIIHRAVTRGLDPNVRLKPSGVEWLGDVPEHWEVQRLGRIASVFNGATPSRMNLEYWSQGTVPWLSSGKVNDYVIESPSELVTERALHECSISIVPKGAVVIGLIGQGKTRGKAALLGIDTCINQNLAAIVARAGLSGGYLHHFLTAFYKTLREFGRGGNQEALNCEIVANWRVAVPPVDEQTTICDYLQRDVLGIQASERRVRRVIEALQEYRTRLIADVVTGKLDVREAAARLPQEAEDLEPLDEADAESEAQEADAGDADAEPEEAEA